MKVDIGARYLGWFSSEAPLPDFPTIIDAFRDCVRRAPNAVALEIGKADAGASETLSYTDLEATAEAMRPTICV